MPYIGALTAVGVAKEAGIGTAVAPTKFLSVYSENFETKAEQITSKGLANSADLVVKNQQGARSVSGGFTLDLEPENCGELFKFALGSEGTSGTTSPQTHTFTRLGNALLPSATVWKDLGLEQFEFTGCMCNTLTISGKAGGAEPYTIAVEFLGLEQGVTLGTQSVTYETQQPFVFSQSALAVGGTTAIADYEGFSLTINNNVKIAHTLTSENWAQKIWSEGMQITGTMDLIFEDLTEYNKFLNGTATNITLTLTHGATIGTGTTHYSLALTMPVVYYSAIGTPQAGGAGVLKASCAFLVPKDLGQSYSLQVTLVNSETAQY